MAQMLKSREAADRLAESIVAMVNRRKEEGVHPAIGTILVKGDPASEYYARAKQKLAGKLGIRFMLFEFDSGVSEQRLLDEISRLNDDGGIHGIMLELPLPRHIDVRKLANAISPLKDIDGLSPANMLACLTGGEGLYPATPQSCIGLLKAYGYTLKGKHVVLIGRGETVGRPLMHMLLRENATVTVCHSYTEGLAEHIARADILIAAAGRAGLVTREMVHPDLIVIDAGINETGEGIVGDVAADAAHIAKAVSPVPGGVGTLTTVMLLANVMKAVELQTLVRGAES